MTVSIYPSKLDGGPLEQHQTSKRQTVNQWLIDNVKGYRHADPAPISISLNGDHLEPKEWQSAEFGAADHLEIFIEPKAAAAAFFGAYGAYIAAAAAVVAVALAFSIKPGVTPTSRSKGAQQGSQLDEASVKGNKVKTNSVIREVAGRRKIYPDYLLPPHRYFVDQRTQFNELLLCLGKGEFDLPLSRVRVGDTPIISLGSDAEVRIYGPGEDVSGNPAATWWHSAPEVGGTSTGTAGLNLTVATEASPESEATAYIFDGYNITVDTGGGELPDDWEPGMVARIDVRYPYTVTGDGVSRSVISGNIEALKLVLNDRIEITGTNAGTYLVFGVTATELTLNTLAGDPVTTLTNGSHDMGIGFDGLRYRFLLATIEELQVGRLTADGANDDLWLGFPLLSTTTATIELDPNSTLGNWLGPFTACPDGELTDEIEWDVMFPSGLVRIRDTDGKPRGQGVDTELQYRDYNTAGVWMSKRVFYSARTLDQIGFTERATLPYKMRPEVRMRRIGSKSSSPSVQDTAQWYGLRAKLEAPSSYDGVTVMAIRLRGGDKLSSQSEALVSAEVIRKLPPVAGGPAVVSRNIADWVAYVTKSIGYTNADLDVAELQRLGALWAARGDTFDTAIESATTVKEAVGNALRAGFSEMTIDRGVLRPVRDEPRTVYEQMYTPQNMTRMLSRSFQAVQIDEYDGVDVEFTNGVTWSVDTVQCRLPGDIGRRVKKVAIEGVTTKRNAWRIGMRERRAMKYRRYTYQFSTELDALNSRYLSFVALGDDVPGYSQSAILESITPVGGNLILVSSEPFNWSAPGAHVVGIRRRDGTLSGPHVATRIDDKRLTIAGPLDFEPDTTWQLEPPHLIFGPLDRWNYPALVTEVSPDGAAGASVTAVNYDVRVYADDDNSPP